MTAPPQVAHLRAVRQLPLEGAGAPLTGVAHGRRHREVVELVVVALRAYQRYVSPLVGKRCRFHPTCSRYAMQAVRVHGAWRGAWLALRRLACCHPLHPGGCDPVPPVRLRQRDADAD